MKLTLQDGFELPLLSEQGKFVALYFCASERSPECVREARGLRDSWSELHLHHVVVLGVSAEDASAHRSFIAEQRLPFDLVSDTDGRIAQAFNLPTFGDYGPHTILVGRDGTIRRAWTTPSSQSRAQEILELASD